ncbi:hypothetical protein AB5J55_35490 [Streptomyces sp. R11]|uniref:Uncharacterized protein n=1 Tax=Streptomyces sp. R11 TaxID=3238625 RepID=A0AB39N8N5_9ACTN
MADRTEMPMEWLRYLKQETARREQEITQHLLQVPDYPPLPECPTCSVAPEQITTRTAEPSFKQDGTPLLVDFKPCGHGFMVSESELLSG